MAVIIKSEWHQVERRYKLEFTLDDVIAIYDVDENEAQEIYNNLISGDADIEQLIEDGNDNGVYLDFEWIDEDDWWTDRKGGYEVTYKTIEEEPDNEDLLKRLEELKAEFDKLIADEQKDEK